MANLKYILNRQNFLFEQDFGMAGTPAEGAPAPIEKPVRFLFLDPSMEIRTKKYPDGSKMAEYPVFSALTAELQNWIKKNIIQTDKNKLNTSTEKLRQENLLNIVTGQKVNVSDEDIPFIEKLKNAVSTDIFGRREASVEVVFTYSGEPTIDDLTITFVPIKK